MLLVAFATAACAGGRSANHVLTGTIGVLGFHSKWPDGSDVESGGLNYPTDIYVVDVVRRRVRNVTRDERTEYCWSWLGDGRRIVFASVPSDRMKTGKEHRVPLSDRAIELLGPAGPPEGFVFPGQRAGKPLSNMAMLKVLQRMGLRTASGGLTVHGFRSTFMDWATEQTNFPSEMRDLALAHTVSDKVEAAYRRGDMFDRRREMMAVWGQFCEPQSGSEKVVSLARMKG